jgi:hypothetical protein
VDTLFIEATPRGRAAALVAASLLASVGCSNTTDLGPPTTREVSATPAADVSISASYVTTVLPPPSGCTLRYESHAWDMSDDGRIVGDCDYVAAEWVGGVARRITPPGLHNTRATAVATGNYVVGRGTNDRTGVREAWLRRPDGRFVTITDVRGAPLINAFPRDVSPAGVVVGYTQTATRNFAFRWSEALGFQNLDPGGASSSAEAINNAGGITVGHVVWVVGTHEATTWSLAGGRRRVRTLGRDGADINDINDSGAMVGWDITSNAPVVWSPMGVPSLAPWPGKGWGQAISAKGRVAGQYAIIVGGRYVNQYATTSIGTTWEVLPRPSWALTSWGLAVDRCGSVAGFMTNDDFRDGDDTPTIVRATVWRRVGCDP